MIKGDMDEFTVSMVFRILRFSEQGLFRLDVVFGIVFLEWFGYREV